LYLPSHSKSQTLELVRETVPNPGRYARSVAIRTESAQRPAAARWKTRWARISDGCGELGRFGVVGVVAFVIDTLIYNALWSHDNAYTAAVISTTISATVAFIGNRFWTWRHRARSSLRREYVLYAIFNVIGLFISLACLWISRDVLGAWQPAIFHTRLADNIAKQGFGLALGTAFRFWAYRRYVFVAPPAPRPEIPT
jgi:putative flippase GtrA